MKYTVSTCHHDVTAKKAVDTFLLISLDHVDSRLVLLSVEKMHYEMVVPDGLYTLTTWRPAPEFDAWAVAWLADNEGRLLASFPTETSS